MKKALVAAFAFVSLHASVAPSLAFADWTPRVRCESGMVVDGNYSFDQGFTAYQLVIRNSDAVANLESVTGRKLANAAGEIVVAMRPEEFGGRFDGSMHARLGMFPVGAGPTQDIYDLLGEFLDSSHYRVTLTHMSYSPGASYRAPEKVGGWIFDGCLTIR
jgi:hypothetical protein